MKKSYVKPQVLFEDFQLSANIAGTCSDKSGGFSSMTCSIQYTGGNLFIDGNANCVIKITGDNEKDYTICYHVPTDLQKLFGS